MHTEITKEAFEKVFGPVSQETWDWIRARNRKETPMKLRVHYYLVRESRVITVGDHIIDEWLQNMAEQHPDVIFFFTTDSTDIWED